MSATELVSLENCTAVQVLSSQDVPLASGTLQLLPAPIQQPTEDTSTPHSADTTAPILTIKIGNAAFPITRSTKFYTHVSSPRIYIFSPVLDDAAIGAGTYVKITLSEDIGVEGSAAEKARDEFEGILVQHGLLEEGPAAIADEISETARESAKAAAAAIGSVAQRHTSGPPNEPLTFSQTTHNVADSAVSGTATMQSYTSSASRTMASVGTSIGASASTAVSRASETIAKAGVAVGERLVHLLGVEDQVERVSAQDGGPKSDNAGTSGAFEATGDEEEAKFGDGTGAMAKQVGEAAMNVGGGIRDGASTIAVATRDAASKVLEHDAGPEAVELANKSGEATGNVTQAAGDTLLATSAVATAGYVAAGAKEGPDAVDKELNPREDFAISTPEH